MAGASKGRGESQAQDVAKLLKRTRVRVRSGGGGTLTSEPVVVVRGAHRSDFELLDRGGRQLGRAARLGLKEAYEFRDLEDRCVLKVEDVGPTWRSLGLTKWRYEVSTPGRPETISVRKVRRLVEAASITQGAVQVGMMRSRGGPVGLRPLRVPMRKKSPVLVLEDRNGRPVGRIHIARKRRDDHRVDFVIHIEDGASEPLRKVAMAAAVIADRELIEFDESSSFGP